jgi:ribosome modulation factor
MPKRDKSKKLVLQRYKSSSKSMRPVDNTPVKDHFLGGYRHGHENDYENQTGIGAIPAPV